MVKQKREEGRSRSERARRAILRSTNRLLERMLARHAREHRPTAGHTCLAHLVQGTVCKILGKENRKRVAILSCDEKPGNRAAHQFLDAGYRA